jgi:protein-S-isoprenylcysteine O-methyltransferase Ste14
MAPDWIRSGNACVLAGIILRRWAVAILGRYFSVDVAAETAQPVIDTGPYRLIRHPACAGLMLSLIGFAMAIGNWVGLAAMLVLPGVAFGYRVKVEEAALVSTLGNSYAHYMHRTRRLIPFILIICAL